MEKNKKIDDILEKEEEQSEESKSSNESKELIYLRKASDYPTFYYLKIGKIVQYVKKIVGNDNLAEKRNYGIILENSDFDETNVFICPISFNEPKSANFWKRCKLGVIPTINKDKKAYAKLDQIRYIDKKRIIKESLTNSNFGYLPIDEVERIQNGFFKLINKRMNINYIKRNTIEYYC